MDVMKSVFMTDIINVPAATMQKSCVAAVLADEVEYSPTLGCGHGGSLD